MTRNPLRARRWTWLVAGMAAGALLLGSANAITERSYKYPTPKTGWLSLGPGAFIADGLFDPAQDYSTHWDTVRITQTSDARCFSAPVNLPQGAVIKRLTAWAKSNGTSDLYYELNRQHLVNGQGTFFDSLLEDDSDTRVSQTISIPEAVATVDNKTFAYQVGACPEPGTDFGGARIKYTFKNAGD